MEIGYLWLALSLFLFLMTTGAAVVLAVVAFPLVRQADMEQFPQVFRSARRRRMWSYGLLAMLSVVALALLFLFPMYSLPAWALGWMAVVTGLLALVSFASWVTSRKLDGDGFSADRLKVLGVLQWASALLWLTGGCVLVLVFVEVVGLV